ncbi:hypothetical protein GCM10017784_29050 [Deinococcus indicus]|nr:hypothetical protein GCM10017784_29050 [Deinococcus indicus]
MRYEGGHLRDGKAYAGSQAQAQKEGFQVDFSVHGDLSLISVGGGRSDKRPVTPVGSPDTPDMAYPVTLLPGVGHSAAFLGDGSVAETCGPQGSAPRDEGPVSSI